LFERAKTVQALYRPATVVGLDEEQETANCTQETHISRGEVENTFVSFDIP
jgi:hypothetical protein